LEQTQQQQQQQQQQQEQQQQQQQQQQPPKLSSSNTHTKVSFAISPSASQESLSIKSPSSDPSTLRSNTEHVDNATQPTSMNAPSLTSSGRETPRRMSAIDLFSLDDSQRKLADLVPAGILSNASLQGLADAKHDTHRVCEVFLDSRLEERDMTRFALTEYLKHAIRQVSPNATDNSLKFARFTSRDLRKIDDSFFLGSHPMILVRQNVVLVNIDPMRAVVLRNRCLLLDCKLAHGVVDKLSRHTQSQDTDLAFELRVLEAILDTVIHALDEEFGDMNRSMLKRLEHLRAFKASVDLEMVRKNKNDISSLDSRVQAIQTMLDDLLDDEDDMCLLHLTRFWDHPEEFDDLDTFDRDDAEALLEAAMQGVNRIRRTIATLTNEIASTERVIDFHFNQVRNRLLTAELFLSLIAIWLGLAAAVAGFFGMETRDGCYIRSLLLFWVDTALISLAFFMHPVALISLLRSLVCRHEFAKQH
jgi:hypothetical protein